MAKKKVKPTLVHARSKQRNAFNDAKPNLFEKLYNRKKFDVLGKKAKGERKHGNSVHDATEKRNKTLLVEYRQLRKANAFIDRRFGEDDESLTAEEKAIARFQKQRMKDLGGDKFALNNGQEETEHLLTHMGQSLGEDDAGQSLFSQHDDEDDRLNREMTEQLNFGGGFLQKKAGTTETDEDPDRRRTKKEVMEEVMAKSKKFKAERQLQREDDLNETEALDNQFKALQGERLMAGLVRPTGKQAPRPGKDTDPLGAAFDVMRRELVFDAKAKVSDRTMTAEELAAEEQQRLQRLEAQRMKRLRGPSGDDLGDDGESEAEGDDTAGLGGFARRRAKRKKREAQAAEESEESEDPLGSDSDDSEEASGSEEEDGGSDAEAEAELLKDSLQARQAARAAGDHPLQQNLRDQAAELLAKYGLAPAKKKNKKSAETPADHSQEESSSQDAGSDIDKGSESYQASDDDNDAAVVRVRKRKTAAQMEAAAIAAIAAAKHSQNRNEECPDSDTAAASDGRPQFAELSSEQGSGEESEEEVDEGSDEGSEEGSEEGSDEGSDLPDAAKLQSQQQERLKSNAQAGSSHQPLLAAGNVAADDSDDIPFIIEAPASYQAFAKLVQGRSAAELQTIVQRVRACNAIALATHNRRKLQVFYGILVQHFANVAGQADISMAAIDVLTTQLLELTAEVPYYAASVARARLTKAQQRLQSALSSPDAAQHSGWPGARDIMLLQLWAQLFPVSDRRHPVTTPLALLTSSYLALCPVTSCHAAAVGLLLSCLALRMTAPAQRLVPEPLTFATVLLFTALPGHHQVHSSHSSQQQSQQWLLPAEGWAAVPAGTNQLSLTEVLQRANASAEAQTEWQSAEVKAGLLQAAVGVVDRASAVFAHLASYAELFAPAVLALRALMQASGLPQDLKTALAALFQKLEQTTKEHVEQRRPLVRKPAARVADIKQYNPQFEEEYVTGKDYDPDRERAEQKRLKRQLNKERRGAMRELRKDAVFLSDEKEKEKAQIQAERAGAYQKAVSFLQQQESDFKSGGQGGMWKKGKKGRRN